MPKKDLRMTPAAVAALANGGIEQQEKAGQEALVSSDGLPRRMLGCDQNALIAMGIIFHGSVDDLFVRVTLPEGWIRKADDHSMWSGIYDEKGRRRINVFYKAAFYDRNAHLELNRRFGIELYVSCDADGNVTNNRDSDYYLTAITDCGQVAHKIGVRLDNDSKDNYTTNTLHYTQAREWLNENYPEWLDPLKYWD